LNTATVPADSTFNLITSIDPSSYVSEINIPTSTFPIWLKKDFVHASGDTVTTYVRVNGLATSTTPNMDYFAKLNGGTIEQLTPNASGIVTYPLLPMMPTGSLPCLPNQSPLAVDDTYTTDKNVSKTITPLALDSDPDGDTLTVSEINGVAITPGVAQTIAVPNGIVTTTAFGTIKFNPTTDFVGSSTFPYKISDDNGGVATANETITITAPLLPLIELLKFATFVDNNSNTYAEVGEIIRYNFTVKNIGPVAIYNVVVADPKCTLSLDTFLDVSAVDSTTFSCEYVLTQADIDAKKVENTASVTGNDANGNFATDISDSDDTTKTGSEDPTVTVLNIIPKNPPIANHDDYTTPIDTQIYLFPTENDSHLDGVYFVVDSVNGQPLYVDTCYTITNGQICIDFDGGTYFNPAPGFVGFVTIPYTIYAFNGTNAASDITIKIGDPVIITAIDDNYTTTPATPVTLNPLGSDSVGTTIKSINGVDLTPGTAQTINVPNGTVDIDAAGIIKFTPSTGFSGLESFPYVITDGAGQTANAVEKITVSAPVAVSSSVSSSSLSSIGSSSSLTTSSSQASSSSSLSSSTLSSAPSTTVGGPIITIKNIQTPPIIPIPTPKSADLKVTKTGSKVKTAIGENLTYTIEVVNNGPDSVTAATLVDSLPAGYSPTAFNCSSSNGATCPTGLTASGFASGISINLNNGGKLIFTIDGTVTVATQLVNTARVNVPAGVTDPNLKDNESTSPTVFDPPSGKKVGTYLGNDVVEWKQVWINEFGNTAVNATITDNIPAGTTYVPNSLQCESRGTSVTTSCTFDSANNSTTWIGQIGADFGNNTEDNATNEVVVKFQIVLPGTMTTVENQATITTESGGTRKSDNPVTADKVDPTKVMRPLEVTNQSDIVKDVELQSGVVLPRSGGGSSSGNLFVLFLILAIGFTLRLSLSNSDNKDQNILEN
jgi:uncharacterized repeat protein (TIGR01451 family)